MEGHASDLDDGGEEQMHMNETAADKDREESDAAVVHAESSHCCMVCNGDDEFHSLVMEHEQDSTYTRHGAAVVQLIALVAFLLLEQTTFVVRTHLIEWPVSDDLVAQPIGS